MSSRLRSISRPMMYSSLRSTTSAASLRLLFLQLPLPVEHTRPGALRLGLGHHARRLIEARQAGVGEHVVGHELAEPLPRLDRLLVPTELVVRHGEPVPGVDVARVEGERLLVPGDRLLELAVAEEIDGGVVEVLLLRHVGSRTAFPLARARRWCPGRSRGIPGPAMRTGPLALLVLGGAFAAVPALACHACPEGDPCPPHASCGGDVQRLPGRVVLLFIADPDRDAMHWVLH